MMKLCCCSMRDRNLVDMIHNNTHLSTNNLQRNSCICTGLSIQHKEESKAHIYLLNFIRNMLEDTFKDMYYWYNSNTVPHKKNKFHSHCKLGIFQDKIHIRHSSGRFLQGSLLNIANCEELIQSNMINK